MKKLEIVKNGVLTQNPTFRLVLGTCPTLAITTTAMNGIAMGGAVIFVLLCSNMMVSLLRNVIPDKVRIPAYVLIIATFVTVVEMVMRKYMYSLYQSLGLFLPLIVVNCIILARADAFASVNKIFDSAIDGVSMGLGFTLSITTIGIIREFFGSGSFFGMEITPLVNSGITMTIFILPAGGFLVYGFMMALINYLVGRKDKKNSKSSEEKEIEIAEVNE
ncbi:MAG: electron transport complex subunit E [Clostridia bacterium]|nr:electron transport complex subunit E [Clostridia bacterium]